MEKLLVVIKLADKLGFDLSQLTFYELVELSIEIKKCFKNAVDKPQTKEKRYDVYLTQFGHETTLLCDNITETDLNKLNLDFNEIILYER